MISILAVVVYAPVAAHEFWVAPKSFRVPQGAELVASLRVGQMMRGTDFPYLSNSFRAFTVTTSAGVQIVNGIEGDIPALAYTTSETGLHTITYHSTPTEVHYDDWDKFREYLAYEGLDEIAELHRSRGLPEKGFTEVYTRVAKSLVQVGAVNEQDQDKAQGLPFELVAQDNPYTAGLGAVKVTLLRFGEPVPRRQVAIFRYDGEVSRTVAETDARGQISVSIDSGGVFLLNATDLQAVEEGDTVWASYWASLTFGVPVVIADPHPLDPLSKSEITRAIRVIGKSGHADRRTRADLVTLAELDKTEVLAWRTGKPFRRRALAVIRNGPDVFEATVDLAAGKLERWQAMPNVQPAIQSSEWATAQRLTKEDPRWIAAMRARGYEDVSQIFCESLSAGFFDLADERGRRLVKMPCYDLQGTRTNIYGRPIEGLISVVDLSENRVIRVIDEGIVPVSADNHEFDEASLADLQTAMRPVRAVAPAGTNVSIDGRLISWQSWSFHLGFDARFGPVLSLIEHSDGSAQRLILYQGHVSEVFVPYMDGAEGWYHRSYMDAGEYGLGALSSPLTADIDCPSYAIYLDAALTKPTGAPYSRKRVVCVFERDGVAPLWRHWEALNGAYEGRPTTELVVRSIPTIGNYDYIVDWVFTQTGEIHINIGATGIDAVKGVAVEDMRAAGSQTATHSGMLVAPNLVAVHHDHYFSLRLDIDVDGPINSFVRERLTAASLPATHPRRSLWRLVPVPMNSEGGIGLDQGPELWRIQNPSSETVLGHQRSYQIQPGSSATSLLSPQDWPQRRASFSGRTLWITAQHHGERFAGGRYPNQSPGGEGLEAYVNGEPVESADIVAWYTIGFHHLTRPEDWPVLPTVWHGVKLRPYGFFDRNPGLGVRRDFLADPPQER